MRKVRYKTARYRTGVILVILVCTMLCGCGEKKAIYAAALGEKESGLKGSLSVPNVVSYTFDGNGDNTISLNTENIIVPETDSMKTVYYEEVTVDNAYKQQIAEHIFEKDKGIYVYDGSSMSEDMLAEMEAYYQKCIDIAMQQNDTNALSMYNDMFAEIIEKKASAKELEAAGNYDVDVYIGYINGRLFLLDFTLQNGGFELKRYAEELNAEMLSVENVTYAIAHTQYGEGVEQDLVQTNDLNVATLGKEEMVAQAEDFLKRIGITDAEVVETAASEWLCYDLVLGQNEPKTVYDGYYITFADTVDGYSPYIGYFDFVESLNESGERKEGLTTQTYEVNINDNGIIGVVCHDNYRRTGKVEDTKLLAWDDMLTVANDNIKNYYSNKKISGNITFNYVELSYYMEKLKDGSYALKPVWVFLSLDDMLITYHSDVYPNELLIIDAENGTPIDIK